MPRFFFAAGDSGDLATQLRHIMTSKLEKTAGPIPLSWFDFVREVTDMIRNGTYQQVCTEPTPG